MRQHFLRRLNIGEDMNKTKAIFLDRDGVIIRMYYDRRTGIIDTPRIPSQVEFIPYAFAFLKVVKRLGYLLIMISSQPDIGIKKISKKNFEMVHKKILLELQKNGINLDGHYYCLHHPFASIVEFRKKCNCRKPNTKLFKDAVRDFNIDLSKSWLVGDGVFDIMAGKSLKVKTILLANIHEAEYMNLLEKQLKGYFPDYLVKNIEQASNLIKNSSINE